MPCQKVQFSLLDPNIVVGYVFGLSISVSPYPPRAAVWYAEYARDYLVQFFLWTFYAVTSKGTTFLFFISFIRLQALVIKQNYKLSFLPEKKCLGQRRYCLLLISRLLFDFPLFISNPSVIIMLSLFPYALLDCHSDHLFSVSLSVCRNLF